MPRLDATPSGEINHVLQRLNLIGGCQTLFWLLIKLNCMSSNSGVHIKSDKQDTAPVRGLHFKFRIQFLR